MIWGIMAEISVGPVKILTNDQGWQAARRKPFKPVKGAVDGEVDGQILYALISAGPDSLKSEIFLHDEATTGWVRVSKDGITTTNPHEEYQDLEERVRIGLYGDSNTLGMKQIQRIVQPPGDRWGGKGGKSMASITDLDVLLAASSLELLGNLGVNEIGTHKELFNGRTGHLAMRWPRSAAPEIPFVIQALTRVLPIYRAIEARNA